MTIHPGNARSAGATPGRRRVLSRVGALLAGATLLPACGGGDHRAVESAPPSPSPAPPPTPMPTPPARNDAVEQVSFRIQSSSDRRGTGVVRFERRTDGSTHVVVTLDFKFDEEGSYDFHIHDNLQGGSVSIFGSVPRRTGTLDIVVVKNEVDGRAWAYDDLRRVDGYAAVHGTPYGDLYGGVGVKATPL